ncbi:MAG TPA: FAD-dependent oxidoreductase, partial [Candidatus Nanoarchaeia archaeon]|nr:FAD-dependent oxidoreductase [Candidatus Nanoarchaeia archaeon]
MVNVVIIGLGAGGFGAALAAKKNRAEVSIIDNKSFDLLHQCGLPFALEGKLAFSGLEHPIHAEKMGIKIVRGKVEKIDAGAKHVFIGKDAVKYDKLIIATGSKPFVAPIKTSNKIYTVHNDRDTQELEKNIVEDGKAIVVGAGAIGLETAVALKKKGMDVKVVDMLASTFPKAIDKDMSEIIEAKLMEKGIKLELGKRIDSIEEKAIVVMATGVKPNVDFLEGSMVEINVSGIVVDDKMQTTVKDIYAAGDCCGVKSLINGQRWNSILANNA